MFVSYGYSYCVVIVIFEHAQLYYVVMCFWERIKVIVVLLKRVVLSYKQYYNIYNKMMECSRSNDHTNK